MYVYIESHLRLVLNAEGYDYSDATPTAGLRLVLHTPKDHPQLMGYDGRSIVLTAGTQNFITVRVRYFLSVRHLFICCLLIY